MLRSWFIEWLAQMYNFEYMNRLLDMCYLWDGGSWLIALDMRANASYRATMNIRINETQNRWFGNGRLCIDNYRALIAHFRDNGELKRVCQWAKRPFAKDRSNERYKLAIVVSCVR